LPAFTCCSDIYETSSRVVSVPKCVHNGTDARLRGSRHSKLSMMWPPTTRPLTMPRGAVSCMSQHAEGLVLRCQGIAVRV
jgi:hypothetical protein